MANDSSSFGHSSQGARLSGLHEPADEKRAYLLIVEDSPTTLHVISNVLSEHYDLVSAGDGEEAWEILQKDRDIELVITDINMPKLTGHQLLVRIRKSDDPHIANLPVFVMTTGDDETDKHLAFINGANDFLNKPIDPIELQARVNVHHKLAITIKELEHSRKAMEELATTDPLTKLQNRRAFFAEGDRSMHIVQRYRTSMSVVLLDIDYFKKINDTYGHHSGDIVLVRVAEILRGLVRQVDIVARIGGEEFCLLLSGTNMKGAVTLAERARALIEEQVVYLEGKPVKFTTSAGVAGVPDENVDTFDALLQIADKRLYLAKENGRNRICVNENGDSALPD